MSSMSELKDRLRAVTQTRQITGAMYLLSTSRVKKAMQNIDYNLSYMNRLCFTMKDILVHLKENGLKTPFTENHEDGITLYICITSDKGLCGSYNADVISRLTSLTDKNAKDTIILSVGTKGTEILKNKGYRPEHIKTEVAAHNLLVAATKFAGRVSELYLKHKIKEAYVVFTEYKSQSVQNVTVKKLLPLLLEDFNDIEDEVVYSSYPIYEPSVEAVFDLLVPRYITGFMYDVFMQSVASENTARMAAMQSATDNADKMTADLQKQINAERQLAITNEIIEISNATDIIGI